VGQAKGARSGGETMFLSKRTREVFENNHFLPKKEPGNPAKTLHFHYKTHTKTGQITQKSEDLRR
jgi:hypothetical protein